MASIVLKDRKLTVSALTLGDLRKLEAALLGVEQRVEKGFGSMLSLVPVIHASLSKLHPEITLEELEQMLDLKSFAEVLDRVLEVSGLKRSAPLTPESSSAGESQPADE